MTRLCATCHGPIPCTRSKRSKHCSSRCANQASYQAWRQRKKDGTPRRVTPPKVLPHVYDISGDEIERRYQAALAVIRRRKVCA